MEAVEIFGEYVGWLRVHVPLAYENLAPGANSDELDGLEAYLGHVLPAEVRAVWGIHNGQRVTDTSSHISYAVPCIPSLSFLSTEKIAQCWDEWAELLADPDFESMQDIGSVMLGAEGRIKPQYASRGWIPLWSDTTRADYIGLDLDPDVGGTVGQIINFGRDEEQHYLCAVDFTELLRILLAEVRSGAWPASTMTIGDRELPWFGDPEKHLFNSLYRRSAQQARRARLVGRLRAVRRWFGGGVGEP
ncbi:SMI1/KNR4 family protein [Nocardia sp. CA-135953]|uniref:SMI1/KNR4 family protein n=1 Tax=Nocardia sp. CA-135953 TaxID=3239978 RepID=UPI003D9953FD